MDVTSTTTHTSMSSVSSRVPGSRPVWHVGLQSRVAIEIVARRVEKENLLNYSRGKMLRTGPMFVESATSTMRTSWLRYCEAKRDILPFYEPAQVSKTCELQRWWGDLADAARFLPDLWPPGRNNGDDGFRPSKLGTLNQTRVLNPTCFEASARPAHHCSVAVRMPVPSIRHREDKARIEREREAARKRVKSSTGHHQVTTPQGRIGLLQVRTSS